MDDFHEERHTYWNPRLEQLSKSGPPSNNVRRTLVCTGIMGQINRISVRITNRSDYFVKLRHSPKNLIKISCASQPLEETLNNKHLMSFVVPKFTFINICSLAKKKNQVVV